MARKTSESTETASTRGAPGDCKDVLQTCATAKLYCYDPLYLNVMRQQCRNTCGFCP
ncbi:unnamed protein product, partial [Enterobius vermicularis]|uniref:ShKT domain-containing protein n=1 Tax=Enterobius vermicularis TaxID=51028 RepID=A0A0N4VQG7_ENTVE